jgi:hypothetical protein
MPTNGDDVRGSEEEVQLEVDTAGIVGLSTICTSRESPCQGVAALVRFGGKVYWWVD